VLGLGNMKREKKAAWYAIQSINIIMAGQTLLFCMKRRI